MIKSKYVAISRECSTRDGDRLCTRNAYTWSMHAIKAYKGAEGEYNWNVMTHGDVREGKWRGNWRMESVASTLHTISEHGVSSITTADAHTSAASSQLNWRLCRFEWTRPFRRKTKYGCCACAITFQTRYTPLQVLSSALDGLNSRPRPPNSRRGLVGPRAGMDGALPQPGIELRFLGCPPCSLVVTPTTLSRPWTLIIPEKRVRKCPQISEIFPQKS